MRHDLYAQTVYYAEKKIAASGDISDFPSGSGTSGINGGKSDSLIAYLETMLHLR